MLPILPNILKLRIGNLLQKNIQLPSPSPSNRIILNNLDQILNLHILNRIKNLHNISLYYLLDILCLGFELVDV